MSTSQLVPAVLTTVSSTTTPSNHLWPCRVGKRSGGSSSISQPPGQHYGHTSPCPTSYIAACPRERTRENLVVLPFRLPELDSCAHLASHAAPAQHRQRECAVTRYKPRSAVVGNAQRYLVHSVFAAYAQCCHDKRGAKQYRPYDPSATPARQRRRRFSQPRTASPFRGHSELHALMHSCTNTSQPGGYGGPVIEMQQSLQSEILRVFMKLQQFFGG